MMLVRPLGDIFREWFSMSASHSKRSSPHNYTARSGWKQAAAPHEAVVCYALATTRPEHSGFAWEAVTRQRRFFNLGLDRVACLLCQLKADRLPGPVLHHHRSRYGMTAMHHVADLQSDEIASA